MKQNLTKGKIAKPLIIFSLPMILGNLLQQLYNVADTLIVGKKMGAAALAAVGSSYALMVLLTSLVLGLCMGSGVVFAQLYGAKQYDSMKISVVNSFFFIIVISVAINILSFLLLDKIILWTNIPAESADYARKYLKIIIMGMVFVSVYNFIAAVLRSIGNTVAPLIFLAVAAFTNIVLYILFIVYLHMGVEGAAIARVIAQALSAICIIFYYFSKAKHISPAKNHFKYDGRLLKLIINNSILTAVQQSVMNFGILLVQSLVNSFGFAASAAFAVVVKIDAFAYMPAQDFGNAFSNFAAQNFGAGLSDRIHKGFITSIKISLSFCATASAAVFIFARPLMLMFVDVSEVETIKIGIEYLRIEGLFYVGIGMLFLLYALYRGIGKPGISIVLTVISLGSRVFLAYALSSVPALGMRGIWWAVPIGWALADLFGLWIYPKTLKKVFS